MKNNEKKYENSIPISIESKKKDLYLIRIALHQGSGPDEDDTALIRVMSKTPVAEMVMKMAVKHAMDEAVDEKTGRIDIGGILAMLKSSGFTCEEVHPDFEVSDLE